MLNEAFTFFLILAVTALLAGLIVYLLMRGRLKAAAQEKQRLAAENKRYKQDMNESKAAQAEIDRLSAACRDCETERNRLQKQLAETAESNATAPATATMSSSGGGEDDALARVKARAELIDFGRIGTASEESKDDLKIIKGIGPFIERKLNALGIYKFEQIANFTADDEDKVNEAIEFFSGRVRRDQWAKQARDLASN